MIIGNSNVFEVDSTSYALKIGDFNNVESKSIVGKSTVLTNGCIIGAGCKIVTEEIIPENCVIYGSKNDRRQQGDRPGPQTLQIEYLSKVLPNYHHLKKPTKKWIKAAFIYTVSSQNYNLAQHTNILDELHEDRR